MEKKRKSGTAYLMQLAGKYKLHLFVSALFGIASALCSFVPYVMVYRSILVLLDGEGNALRYGLIAAAAPKNIPINLSGAVPFSAVT